MVPKLAPQLSQDVLEGLLVVLATARDEHGCYIHIPLECIFKPDVIKQLDELMSEVDGVTFH